MATIHISVIVPAHNAGETLDQTLASVHSQTVPNWEAIIVDDGSTDNTATVAALWVQRDNRIRLLPQKKSGHSAARNAGIRAARYEWLLFLDADDWLAPKYFERMTQELSADPQLDGVVCGCVRVTPSGKLGRPAFFESSFLDGLFPAFARDCPFAIHNCVVRKSLAQEVGGFDADLATCADWDFWQRVARTGPRFGAVREVLAFYRMRHGSVSTNANRVLMDGLTVIRRGHARDPRVPAPHREYADGMPADGLREAMFRHALGSASFLIAGGADARPLLRLLWDETIPSLDPLRVASWLFEYIPIAAARTTEDWPEMWPVVAEQLGTFLLALEARSGAVELGQRSIAHLERLILESADLSQPLTIGGTHGVHIDVDGLIANVAVPEGVERLFCVVTAAGQHLGAIQVQAPDGFVAGKTLADAIASDFSWRLLCWHFHVSWPCNSWLAQGLCMLGKPRLLGHFLRLMLNMRAISMGVQLLTARSASRRSRLKEFLRDAARRLVREAGVVKAATSEESPRTGIAYMASVISE